MKGKKADTDFIAEFVKDCASKGKTLSEDIVAAAEKEISSIDDQLKRVVDLKKRRSKLVDVVFSFKKDTKENTADQRILSFFDIKDLKTASTLCSMINVLSQMDNWASSLSKDSLFVIKQLIVLKIFNLEEDYKILPGERFNEFLDFTKNKILR